MTPLSTTKPKQQKETIIILGCGIIGLCSAIQISHLLRSKNSFHPDVYSIEIWTKEQSPHITSDKAGAIWEPFMAMSSVVNTLANETWEYFQRELEVHGTQRLADHCGIQFLEGFTYNLEEKPAWANPKQKWQRLGKDSWKSSSFLIDMSKYMPELLRRATELGVKVRTVTDMKNKEDIQRKCQEYVKQNPNTHIPFIVNATGLGSRELFNDEDMMPVCGYTLHLRTHTGKELINRHFYIRDEKQPEEMMYILPRTDGKVVCGGTAYPNRWDVRENDDEAEKILSRIDRYAPHLKIREVAKVEKHSIGLRPFRSSGIRIETDSQSIENMPVIHAYGLGGSGVTLCWGVGNLVARLADVQLSNISSEKKVPFSQRQYDTSAAFADKQLKSKL